MFGYRGGFIWWGLLGEGGGIIGRSYFSVAPSPTERDRFEFSCPYG